MAERPENNLFVIVHTRTGSANVLSIDIQRHHDNGGVSDQYDIFDELLKDVEPLPQLPPSPVRVCAVEHAVDAEQPQVVRRKRQRHTILSDAIIIKFVDVHGPKWRELARALGGRQAGYNDDIVRNRYIRVMEAIGKPYITNRTRSATPRKPARKVERWTAKDDALIREGLEMFGSKWTSVAEHLGDSRTAQAVRNRAYRVGIPVPLVRRRKL